MRPTKFVTAFISLIALSSVASAEHHKEAEPNKTTMVVAIAVDQLSADLFSEYRSTFTDGLKRFADGAVFPSGYQSHAATETCPGHSTIMTGAHPGRAGIIANSWIDLGVKRDDKTIYCAEDERVEGTNFGDITAAKQGDYVASSWHLLVPTLGERLKKVSPKSRNVAIAGKDRSALMMGGTNVDAIYWWKGKQFVTHAGTGMSSAVNAVNMSLAETIDKARAPFDIPQQCGARNRKISHGEDESVGEYAFQRPPNGGRYFRLSPDFDAATVSVANGLVDEMKLGQGEAIDMLSVSLSATDYIGHAFGTGGLEMCIQMSELDRNIGNLFQALDESGVDYVAVLTADHGGHDLPERLRQQGVPEAQRIDSGLNAKAISKKLKAGLKIELAGQLIYAGSPFGDYYVTRQGSQELRDLIKSAAMMEIAAHPQVEAVLDSYDLAKMPMPQGPAEEWTLAERTRASFHKDRSGDFIVLLKKAVTPIASTVRGYVATHGSPWDYDRRVPIAFWRKGLGHFEQPLSVKTVDIAPTLASLIGLNIPADEIDGRCLDIDGGEGSNCP